jgi:transposase InsO family protein
MPDVNDDEVDGPDDDTPPAPSLTDDDLAAIRGRCEVFRATVSSYGAPEEVLTDNGSQYVTWRGKGAFTRELEKRGVRQVVASPRHPQTLGKTQSMMFTKMIGN